MADPGFPIGGEVPTPDATTFCKIFMSKRKNWDPWGAPGGPLGSANDCMSIQFDWLHLFSHSLVFLVFVSLHLSESDGGVFAVFHGAMIVRLFCAVSAPVHLTIRQPCVLHKP